MKAFINSVGDRDVGINDAESIVESNFEITDGEYSNREDIREQLQEMFHEFHDVGKTSVYFEDECPDCHSILKQGDCQNTGCPSCNRSLYQAIQEGDEEGIKTIEEKVARGEMVRII